MLTKFIYTNGCTLADLMDWQMDLLWPVLNRWTEGITPVLWVSKLALTSKESDLNPNTIGSKIQSCDVLLFNNSFESKFNAQSNLQC